MKKFEDKNLYLLKFYKINAALGNFHRIVICISNSVSDGQFGCHHSYEKIINYNVSINVYFFENEIVPIQFYLV